MLFIFLISGMYKINFLVKSFLSMFVFFVLGIVFANAQVKTITVNLSNTPSSISVKKTPLKYNKDFAYSFVFDD